MPVAAPPVTTPAAAPAAPRIAPADRAPLPVRPARRAPSGTTTRLNTAKPTVTLSRLQSGVGVLELALTRAPSAGDLSLGCVLETDRGEEAAVQAMGGHTVAPRGAAAPLVRLDARSSGDVVVIDLGQVRSLRRALVYGYSPSIATLTWDGVITASTFGGARLEIPFDRRAFSGTMAMVTIYNVGGELVLRSEMEEHFGPPETAAVAFGYGLPWLDGRVPAS